MNGKEAQRLENSIVLSIQYSRLLEEITDTKDKITVLQDKKFDLTKTKKIERSESFIKEVKETINEIKKNFTQNRYNIYEANQLETKLNLLSKRKDFETIKYNIAIRTVLDNTVEYKNTDDFIEKISEILFNDKNKMKEIYKELYKIHGILTNTKLQVQADSKVQELVGAVVPMVGAAVPPGTPMIPKLKDAAKFVFSGIKKHPKIAIASAAVGGIVAVGGGVISGLRKKHKTAKAFKNIDSSDLEYVLLVNALCLKIASNYMDEVEYYKYFQNKMRSINTYKKKIDKELFIKWYDKENNSKKIMLLNRFDEYLIKHIDLIKK